MKNYYFPPYTFMMQPFMTPFIPDGPPMSPPPQFIPEPSPYRVDPGSIKQCKKKYTYIWLNNGDSFWFYPTYISRNSISGYRWIGFWWVHYGTDLRNITSFVCF